MRIEKTGSNVRLWLSAKDTCFWATRSGNSWPCSQLAGKRLFAEFNGEDLVDVTINGKTGVNVPVDEFNAITDDFIVETE